MNWLVGVMACGQSDWILKLLTNSHTDVENDIKCREKLKLVFKRDLVSPCYWCSILWWYTAWNPACSCIMKTTTHQHSISLKSQLMPQRMLQQVNQQPFWHWNLYEIASISVRGLQQAASAYPHALAHAFTCLTSFVNLLYVECCKNNSSLMQLMLPTSFLLCKWLLGLQHLNQKR